MLMVSKLEYLLQLFYGYFSNSPKHHLEFQKLVEITETKGLKVDVKTRWINMLAPLKYVEKKYKILIVKITIDFGSMEGVRS
jgi:hypothetical protein